MVAKRSKGEILAEILDACVGSASKAKIVYQANLNFGTAKFYLEMLTKKEFLQIIDGDPVLYKTTSSGLKLLKHLQSIQIDLD